MLGGLCCYSAVSMGRITCDALCSRAGGAQTAENVLQTHAQNGLSESRPRTDMVGAMETCQKVATTRALTPCSGAAGYYTRRPTERGPDVSGPLAEAPSS